MYNPKMDCILNMVTLIVLLQHLSNDDEEIYDLFPMDVSTVIRVAQCLGRGKIQLTLGIIEQTISIQIWILGNQMKNPKLDQD